MIRSDFKQQRTGGNGAQTHPGAWRAASAGPSAVRKFRVQQGGEGGFGACLGCVVRAGRLSTTTH